MRRTALLLGVLGTMACLAFGAAPAYAQATRTWVSGVGDDVNPCSRTAPCKTFAGAISKTAAGGEINCLDPGGFGTLIITKSISVICDTGTGGVIASGTNGFVVNVAATDKVLLQGLDIEGLKTGLNGVQVIGSGQITIRKCSIRNFTGNGVNLVGTAGARVVIEDSIIINNAGGFNIQGAAGALNTAFLLNSLLDNNTTFAVQVTGGSTLVLIRSLLIGSATGIVATGGAAVISYGNNVIRGGGAPTQTLPRQ
jgi:hypothetical protein